jgi:hypothetical protein
MHAISQFAKSMTLGLQFSTITLTLPCLVIIGIDKISDINYNNRRSLKLLKIVRSKPFQFKIVRETHESLILAQNERWRRA